MERFGPDREVAECGRGDARDISADQQRERIPCLHALRRCAMCESLPAASADKKGRYRHSGRGPRAVCGMLALFMGLSIWGTAVGIKGKMEKCTFCEDRPVGMKRACEEICPTEAIISGKVDELSQISRQYVAESLFSEKTGGAILGHESDQ